MHRAIAGKLREAPELIGIAQDNLRRWRSTAGRSAPYLDAWEILLARPVDELLAVIVEDSERMWAMRQASPFAGVLRPQERWRIYYLFAVGTYHSRGGGRLWMMGTSLLLGVRRF